MQRLLVVTHEHDKGTDVSSRTRARSGADTWLVARLQLDVGFFWGLKISYLRRFILRCFS